MGACRHPTDGMATVPYDNQSAPQIYRIWFILRRKPWVVWSPLVEIPSSPIGHSAKVLPPKRGRRAQVVRLLGRHVLAGGRVGQPCDFAILGGRLSLYLAANRPINASVGLRQNYPNAATAACCQVVPDCSCWEPPQPILAMSTHVQAMTTLTFFRAAKPRLALTSFSVVRSIAAVHPQLLTKPVLLRLETAARRAPPWPPSQTRSADLVCWRVGGVAFSGHEFARPAFATIAKSGGGLAAARIKTSHLVRRLAGARFGEG
jgi:hypothetical protein